MPSILKEVYLAGQGLSELVCNEMKTYGGEKT